MKRFSDDEILGRYVPRGLSPPVADGQQAHCARLHCGHVDRSPGTRTYRWGLRQGKGPLVELCARCHKELATIITGG